MSVPSSYVRCHGCSYEGVIQWRPITLEYRLASGETVKGYRQFAWCTKCRNITDAEKAIEPANVQREIDSIHQRNRGFFKYLFGISKEDAAQLESLHAKLRLSQMRRSPPRCLRCGGIIG